MPIIGQNNRGTREDSLWILGSEEPLNRKPPLQNPRFKWWEHVTDKKLLLVEDNELNREIATEILKEYGFTVDVTENGKEALDKISASRPGEYDLVLMDIQMPVMDGYEATKRIRALDNPKLSSIPIVAMTANAFEEDRKAAFDSGMDGFVSKPIVIEEVISELNRVL